MKKSSRFIVVICALCIFSALTVKSQGISNKPVRTVSANEKWHSIKINAAGNTLNGVSFFSCESACGTNNAVLIRLVNSNTYPVTVSSTENGVKKSITVAASSQMEGTCEAFSDAGGNNAVKLLTYVKPTTDAEKEAKRKVLSTVEVVEKK